MSSKIGKRYAAAGKIADPKKLYSVQDAVDTVKKLATAKFDESIDVAMRLGVDPRKADQVIRGICRCPTARANRNACS